MATATSTAPPTTVGGVEVPVCFSCQQAIINQAFIRVGTFQFHKEHFTCSVCSKGLSGQKFHFRDQKFYCIDDFVDRFCQTCKKCGQKILQGQVVQAFGGHYHPACFVCKVCSVPFTDGKYFDSGGDPYCETHFLALLPETRCASCNLPVRDTELVKASGKSYHAECLRCSYCNISLGQDGSLFQKDGLPYCHKDYMNFFMRRCSACGEHITTQSFTVNDEYYHQDCLRCDACFTLMSSYMCANGHLRCERHVNDPAPDYACGVCTRLISDGPILCNGLKVHEACFNCTFCQARLEKNTAKLRDDLLCCPQCVLQPRLTRANAQSARSQSDVVSIPHQPSGSASMGTHAVTRSSTGIGLGGGAVGMSGPPAPAGAPPKRPASVVMDRLMGPMGVSRNHLTSPLAEGSSDDFSPPAPTRRAPPTPNSTSGRKPGSVLSLQSPPAQPLSSPQVPPLMGLNPPIRGSSAGPSSSVAGGAGANTPRSVYSDTSSERGSAVLSPRAGSQTMYPSGPAPSPSAGIGASTGNAGSAASTKYRPPALQPVLPQVAHRPGYSTDMPPPAAVTVNTKRGGTVSVDFSGSSAVPGAAAAAGSGLLSGGYHGPKGSVFSAPAASGTAGGGGASGAGGDAGAQRGLSQVQLRIQQLNQARGQPPQPTGVAPFRTPQITRTRGIGSGNGGLTSSGSQHAIQTLYEVDNEQSANNDRERAVPQSPASATEFSRPPPASGQRPSALGSLRAQSDLLGVSGNSSGSGSLSARGAPSSTGPLQQQQQQRGSRGQPVSSFSNSDSLPGGGGGDAAMSDSLYRSESRTPQHHPQAHSAAQSSPVLAQSLAPLSMRGGVSTGALPDSSNTNSNSLLAPTQTGQRTSIHGSSRSWAGPSVTQPDQHKIQWTRGALIGSGSFGKVYQGMNQQTGELIAVKQIPVTDENTEQARAIQSEIALMQQLRHPNIVALLGTETVGKKLNIIMEYVPGNSLDQLLSKFGKFNERVVRGYTKQLLLALEYCHSKNVVHRDIKGKNILVDMRGVIKLADFGSAKMLAHNLSTDAPSLSYNYTPLWTAPEVLKGNYNSKIDVWSLGCVIIEMATGKAPWSEEHFENPFRALYHIGNSDAIPRLPDGLSVTATDFLLHCLQRDPEKRWTVSELLQHPWITDEITSAPSTPRTPPRSPSSPSLVAAAASSQQGPAIAGFAGNRRSSMTGSTPGVSQGSSAQASPIPSPAISPANAAFGRSAAIMVPSRPPSAGDSASTSATVVGAGSPPPRRSSVVATTAGSVTGSSSNQAARATGAGAPTSPTTAFVSAMVTDGLVRGHGYPHQQIKRNTVVDPPKPISVAQEPEVMAIPVMHPAAMRALADSSGSDSADHALRGTSSDDEDFDLLANPTRQRVQTLLSDLTEVTEMTEQEETYSSSDLADTSRSALPQFPNRIQVDLVTSSGSAHAQGAGVLERHEDPDHDHDRDSGRLEPGPLLSPSVGNSMYSPANSSMTSGDAH